MSRENPLETFFDMDVNTVPAVDERNVVIQTSTTTDEVLNPVVVPKVPFKERLDDEDVVIAGQLQDVFDKAIAVFHSQQELTEIVDPKFAARNAEVAGTFLTTALQAVQLRAKIKSDKDKTQINASVGAVINGNVTNNVITANRNDLIKMMHAKKNDISNMDF